MTDLEALFLIQEGLPRNGPGSDALTLEALSRLGRLPPSPRVLDLGCGVGRSTIALARALGPGARLTGVDVHAPFLDRLAAAAAREGLADRISTRLRSFDALEDAPGSVDLLWCESAAWALGFERALRLWRPLLAPGGRAAVSEVTWFTDRPPADVAAFWREAYPAIGTVAENEARARAAGWDVLGTIPFPPSAWWDEYYRPMEARIGSLAGRAAGDEALARAIAEHEREIATYRAHPDAYGYAFFLLG